MKQKSRKLFYWLGFLAIVVIGLVFPRTTGIPDTNQNHPAGSPDSQVLSNSYNSTDIYIRGDEYSAGSVVAQASTDEPAIDVSAYGKYSDAEVTLYRSDSEALLSFLTHDAEYKQISPDPDVNRLQLVTTQKVTLTAGNSNSTHIPLPLEARGIWYVVVKAGTATENAFIIRSNVGVVTKEGNDQFIFWAQNFQTKRSVSGGNIILYSLKNPRQELYRTELNQDGIAATPLYPDTDIALFTSGEDISLVPVNMQYLNTGYNRSRFSKKSVSSKYFIFTDRPLYRPGDTINFKAILRDDDDARLTIPTGQAEVKIYSESEEDAPYHTYLPISSGGTLNGSYILPESAKVGYYTLKVKIPRTNEVQDDWYSWEDNTIGFQVEYFRKPEYSIDVEVPQTEFVSGDPFTFKVKGAYFSGQPLTKGSVTYKVESSDFYDYEYLQDQSLMLSDDYRYGYWYGQSVTNGTVALDSKGEAVVTIDTKAYPGKGGNRVFSIEAEFDDGSGNPSFSRKNILVYPGEVGIYRKEYTRYGSRVGEPYSLPLVLHPRRAVVVANQQLTVKVHREYWISYQEPDKKYPSYRQETQDFPDMTVTTDGKGEGVLTFTPPTAGSYKFTVSYKDAKGNLISRELHAWFYTENVAYFSGKDRLSLASDKETYFLGDTARVTISSVIPDRDLLVSLERGRTREYQVVRLSGETVTLNYQVTEEFLPNLFVKVVSFADDTLDRTYLKLPVSLNPKKLKVSLTPDRDKYGPGDTATVNVRTTDTAGNPVSAETAVWAVDKALFELVDQDKRSVLDAFWYERYHGTGEAHSLEGIYVNAAEMGGGCFAADTPVLMADGTTKPISQVKIGDTVRTRRSGKDAVLVSAEVTGIHKTNDRGFLIINGTLRVTTSHKLFINNSWAEASTLEIGDLLRDDADRSVEVHLLEWQEGKFEVYNLEIDKYRTFFAGGVWVHNQKGGGGRSVFKDTAYWNPVVHTDTAGFATVRFKLPDNLTTWVVASVGSTETTMVGQTTAEVLVTKDVIVRPILPNIFRTGDEAVISALVHNFTAGNYTFDVDLAFDAGEIEVATHSAVPINSQDTQQLYWKVKPRLEKVGKLRFSARARENKTALDTIIQEVPVREFGFPETRGYTGINNTELKLALSPDAHPTKTEVTVSLAASLTGTLSEAAKYLLDYPYGCIEQTTSRLVPLIIAQGNPDIFAEAMKDKKIDDMVKKGLQRLISLQHDDGSWSWWSSGSGDYFITSYVVEYLTKAKGMGITIDQGMLDRAYGFLKRTQVYNPDTKANEALPLEIEVARQYGLSFFESVEGKAQITKFDNLSPDFVSLAVLANVRNGYTNSQTNGLIRLTAMAKQQGDSLFWDAGNKSHFGSVDASTALAVRALIAGVGDKEKAAQGIRYLTRNRRYHYWSNSYATAQVIAAAVDFARTSSELVPDYSYTLKLDGEILATGQVTDPKLKKEIKIPKQQISKTGSVLTVEKTGEGQLYSTVIVRELHTDRNAQAIANSLSLSRRFVSEKGAGHSLSVGDTVNVELTLKGLASEEQYGVIEDQLPAGLIPINTKFKNEQFGTQPSYYSYDYTDRDITENGLVMSLFRVPAGERTYTYQARAVSEGTFITPPAVASLMYAPEINGRSAAETVVISKDSTYTAPSPPQFPEIPAMPRKLELADRIILGGGAVLLFGGLFFALKLRKQIFIKISSLIEQIKRPPKPPVGPTPPVASS